MHYKYYNKVKTAFNYICTKPELYKYTYVFLLENDVNYNNQVPEAFLETNSVMLSYEKQHSSIFKDSILKDVGIISENIDK